MANLLGSPFRKYVNKTVKDRQHISGKGQTSDRSIEVISALNSRTAWVKLASSVFVEQNRLNILQKNNPNNPLINNITPGIDLALQNVLQGGLVSKGNQKNGNPSEKIDYQSKFGDYDSDSWRGASNKLLNFQTTHREGILGHQTNPAYGVGGTDFGYSPMPGITDVSITDLNLGSIKKSKINIKCHNRAQFDVIDILYLRLGYTVCLEWGWNQYVDINSEGIETPIYIDNTLIDDEFWKIKDEDYSVFLDKIENKRKIYGGNYDGIIGVISNFSWDFQPDGTYDIRLEITSLGDIIESLKVNLPPLVKDNIDPYADTRLKDLAGEIKDEVASEDDFYNTLYPNLKDELRRIYGELKDSLNFTYYDIIPTIGTYGPKKVTFNGSVNPINWDNVGDVAGGRELLKNKIGDKFNWGTIFQGKASKAVNLGRDGGINNRSWQLYQTKPDGFNYIEQVIDDLAETSIVYQEEAGGEWKRDKFLTTGKTYSNSTDKKDYKYNEESRKSFEQYFIMGAITLTLNINNFTMDPGGALLLDETVFGESNEKKWIDLTENDLNNANKALFAYYGEKQFLTLFYSYVIYLNLAGGKEDDRFSQEKDENYGSNRGDDIEFSTEDDSRANEIIDFKNSIERSKNKNKINYYFFTIRELNANSTYNLDLKNSDIWTVWDPKDGEDDAVIFKDGTIVGDYREYMGKENNYEYNGTSDSGFFTKDVDIQTNPIFTTMGSIKGDKYITVQGPQFDASSRDPKNGIYVDPIGAALNFNTDWGSSVGFPKYPYSKDGLFSDEFNQTPIDFFKLDVQPIQDTYFIRFKVLLNFIEEFLIPKKKSKNKNTPIIRIDTETKTNICYSIDNMISLNPRKVIIQNKKFYAGKEQGKEVYEKLYPELEDFQISNEGYRYGQIMNVYFSFSRVEEIFNSVDNNNQVSLFTALKALCEDINSSLGDVNNIEPTIDKDLNIIKFIDQTSIPKLEEIRKSIGGDIETDAQLKKSQVSLEVFGYNPISKDSTFMRNVGITTEISKQYATAITIGATAQGEIPGMEATAFSRWNIGLKDRFKEYLVDGEKKNRSEETLKEKNKQVLNNYKSMLNSGYNKLGFSKKDTNLTINSEFIDTNRNITDSYFKYAQAETTLSNYDSGSNQGIIESSIGFLPINLKVNMDGLGGIRIYDFVKINTSFLPSNYPETLEFICTGVNHVLSNNDWTTNLKTIATYTDQGSKSTSASS